MSPKSLKTELEVHGSAPLYKQVEQGILQCLADGEWRPGDQLPTEAQLAERFGVALFTIRAGISELVSANILVRRQGKGTFVARHTRQRQRFQFSHIFRNDGAQILPERELISFTKTTALPHVAAILRLQHVEVYRVNTLLTLEGEAAGYMEITVPAQKFRNLSEKAIRENRENLYAVYQDVCGVNVIRIQERVYAEAPETPVALALKILARAPVLRVERIAYTYNDLPVEYRVRYFDASKYHYRFDERGV